MTTGESKSLMRSVGEFFGHIIHAIKTPADDGSQVTEINREVMETTRDGVTLRRTTIDEIEVPGDSPCDTKDQDTPPCP